MNLFEELPSLLTEAGLSDPEVVVYLALLNSPAQSKWQLVEKTGLNRNKVYRAFESLKALNLVSKTGDGVMALPLDALANTLSMKERKAKRLASKLRKYDDFMAIPTESVAKFEILDDADQILDRYLTMSEIKTDTCLDFGDLESFVPVVGGLSSVFEFRANRFKQTAKNVAICTTLGPATSCMARENDLERFKSNIQHLNLRFDGKWVIFSDSNDYVMINDCSDIENPNSVFIESKVFADMQRLYFSQFYQSIEKA